MSAGNFVTRSYQATYDSSAFHPIRVQPETEGLVVSINGTSVNNAGGNAGDATSPISARVSGGNRQLGLVAAKIRVRFTPNSGRPDGYSASAVITLPALNVALRNAPRGSTGTYLGSGIEVLGVTPESVR